MPLPSSETDTTTWTCSLAAFTRMGDDSGEFLAAVGEQVAQHLDHARPVSHHPWKTRRKVYVDAVPALAAAEGISGLTHQRGNVGRFRRDPKRASLDLGHVRAGR